MLMCKNWNELSSNSEMEMSPSPELFNPSLHNSTSIHREKKLRNLQCLISILPPSTHMTDSLLKCLDMEHKLQDLPQEVEKLRDCRVDGPETQKYMNQRDIFQKMVGMKHIRSSTPWQPRKIRSITDIDNTQIYPPTRV